MQLIQKIHDYFMGIYLAHERRKVLKRKFERLTDGGLLDRATVGGDER